MLSFPGIRDYKMIRPNWLLIAALFLVLCLIWGGGSRADVQSQIPMRVAAIWFALAAVFSMSSVPLRRLGLIFWLLILLAFTIGVQLIPLPPELWASFAGRELLAEGAKLAGQEVWRPFTLVPDRGWNSLFATLPAFAALFLTARLQFQQRRKLVLAMIAITVVSAVIGLLQLAGVGGRALYFYRITNEGAAVGMFANRNHQAVLIAICFPMLALLASWRPESRQLEKAGLFASLIIGIFLLPMVLATGSRSGLFLSIIGIAFATLIYWARGGDISHKNAKASNRWALVGMASLAILVVAATIYFSRSEALDRLFADEGPDLRTALLGTYLEMIQIYLPFGSGFGSFESAFKIIEPYSNLNPSYLNHAHNDLMEFIIEGGVVAGALLGTFLAWFVSRSVKIWRARPDQEGRLQLARLATVIVAMLLVASLLDYPLRTPTMSVIFIMNCAFIQLWAKKSPRV